ncbi:MAG TPA: hypothetical protein VGU27_09705, partial [Candidatus Eisenbacteria bacterium]|nr:hypothetical protein [Candidatus Eisenbacteria bacterium]
AALLARGLELTPDGWAYWESGVSLLTGHGYAYFGGQPIRAFPPLFSLLVAGFSAALGVSGLTLIVLLAALAAASGYAWTRLYAALAGAGQAGGPWPLLFALYVALSVAGWSQALLADTLGLALLGATLFPLARLCATPPAAAGPGAAFRGRDALGLALGLTALLLTRNAALAFVAAAAVVALVCVGGSWRRLAVLVATAAPVAAAWYAQARLGQTHAHALGAGLAPFTPADYLWQLATGLAELFAHPLLGAGSWAAAAVAVAAFGWALARVRPGAPAGSRATLALAATALLATAALYAMFNLTRVHDALRGRFLWHLPLVLTGTLAVALSGPATGWARRWAGAAMVLLVLLQAGLVGVELCRVWTGARVPDVLPMDTIRPGHVDAPPVAAGRLRIVSPPTYPWIVRHPRGAPLAPR